MNVVFERFKELTGIKEADIARRFRCSRQHISQLKRRTSLTHRLAFSNILSIMVREEIVRCENQIEKLKLFAKDYLGW